jgi:hypothetical protein
MPERKVQKLQSCHYAPEQQISRGARSTKRPAGPQGR